MAAPETLSAEQMAAPALPAGSEQELKNVSYECFILALSIISLVNIVLLFLVRQPEVGLVLTVMDVVLSCIFLGDFAYRLFTAPTKRGYFVGQRGWLDLLSSLPLPQVKVFRLFRVVRVVRLLREVGPRRFFDAVLRDRASSALLVVIFLALLLLEFGSVLMLAIEIRAPDGNITDASDALWYVYVTVTTVGYGDRYPVTNAGPAGGRADHDRRRRPLRHPDRLPGQRLRQPREGRRRARCRRRHRHRHRQEWRGHRRAEGRGGRAAPAAAGPANAPPGQAPQPLASGWRHGSPSRRGLRST